MAEGGITVSDVDLADKSKEDIENQYLINDEYETQLYEYTPTSFIDKLYNCYYDYTYNGLQCIQSQLIENFNEQKNDQEIRNSCDKVLENFIQKLDKCFDKFEVYSKTNILNIPKNIVLPEDEVHERTKAKKTLDELESEYKIIEENIIFEQKRKAALLHKQKQQDITIKNLSVLAQVTLELKQVSTNCNAWENNLIRRGLHTLKPD